MKKLFFMLSFVAFSISMMGQTRVIKGYVVDKKTGNYLPGAEVTATGGAESTTTDADGSFSLEVGRFVKSATARYAGMADKKMRIGEKEELVFRMRKDKGFWFLNFEGGLVVGPKPAFGIDGEYNRTVGVIGLMGGYLDKWGVYGKLTVNPWGKEILPMGSVGATKRIFSWLHASLGLGVGLGLQEKAGYRHYDFPSGRPTYSYYSYYDYEYSYPRSAIQVMPEIGLIFKLSKRVSANITYGIGIWAGPYSYYGEEKSEGSSSVYDNNISSYIDYPYTNYYGGSYSGALNHNLTIGVGYVF